MCSSGNCDVGGLIGGPVGSLVGVGIKALISGAPIGPRSAEALKKPTEKERIQDFYDNMEAHLKGALQVLQPALEIKQILSGASKSAERDRSAISPQPVIQYYSPQNPKICQTSHCQNRCCCLKRTTSCSSKKDKSTDKSTSQSKPSSTNCKSSIKIKNNEPKKCSTITNYETSSKSTENYTSQSKSSSSNYKSSIKTNKNEPKKCSTSVNYETSSKYSGKSSNDDKSVKILTRVSKSKNRSETCCMCHVTLKDNIVLAELPCDHFFCYTCLAIGNGKQCRKCNNTYDMINVTQIFHKRSIRQ